MSRLIQRAKKAALEKAVLLLLRSKVVRFGDIRKFSLDTSAKEFSAEIELRGDPEPIVVSEAHYRIESDGHQTMLILHGMKVSREWVQNLLDDYFSEIPIKAPDFVRLIG
jgi:DNA-binding Lrp family transcriptional regulator